MKKYLPIGIFLLGLVVFGGVFLLLRGSSGGTNTEDQEETIAEIPFADRPVLSLTPSADGHWLKMVIGKIKVKSAENMDYELLYTLPDGRQQGVPGTVELGEGSIERDLLLGSESSGKFRYDDGVLGGTITLRFRNGSGKLVGKLTAKFNLLTRTKELSSTDSVFKFTLDKTTKDYYVVIETLGVPSTKSEVNKGPYGVFASSKSVQPGVVTMPGDVSRVTGSGWESLSGGKSSDIGIFVSSN